MREAHVPAVGSKVHTPFDILRCAQDMGTDTQPCTLLDGGVGMLYGKTMPLQECKMNILVKKACTLQPPHPFERAQADTSCTFSHKYMC
jgi:hypothetical protein